VLVRGGIGRKEEPPEITLRLVIVRQMIDVITPKESHLPTLMSLATSKQVEQMAGNLEKMPPKSTYFYPKLLSGLVFNSLKGS
jgi:uncharacterized protein (DUF1015 family)